MVLVAAVAAVLVVAVVLVAAVLVVTAAATTREPPVQKISAMMAMRPETTTFRSEWFDRLMVAGALQP